jgi:hypothetical protein
MAFPALIARVIPWGAAAQAGVQLARLGMDYKLERDRLKTLKRAKDLDAVEARLDVIEDRFQNQLRVMEELADGLQEEIGKMRRGLIAAGFLAVGSGALALIALLVVLL